MIGTAVGSYRITAKIAEGGMGTVFRAEHTVIGKTAAIKILHPELSHNRSIVDRFFNEAKATTAIRHPGIVEVFDFGYLQSGAAFLIMEFLDGEPLSRYLKRRGGRIAEPEAAWLIRGMCSALAAAHAKSIVHRDLKPDNVFMVPDPEAAMGVRPKLLDFGIAKLSGSEISSSKTRTGSVMGTPTYMSPEQCKGTGDVDHRADLYSLGAMLYEMLCGRPPFVSEGAGELIGAHLFVAPDSPRVYAPNISIAMETMVLRLLAKNRDQRPRNANELADTLAHLARASGGGWQSATTPPHPPRVQTPVRGVPAGPLPPASPGPFNEATQPMSPVAEIPTPRPMRPSRLRVAEAATVMEPLVVPPSGPMDAARPQESWPPMQGMHPMHPMHPVQPMHQAHVPMPTPPPPHMMTPPPPMPTPAPLPTPAPKSVTTLSGASGARSAQPPQRTRWPIAIAVILVFAAASAATTYLVVTRGDKNRAAGGGGGEPAKTVPPPKPEPVVTPPDAAPALEPVVTAPDAAPAVVTPDAAAPDAPASKKKRTRDEPGSVIDLDGDRPPKKKPPRKKPDQPPGPIETDI